jgi:prepilin-type N-terminal cleavage/methylation domain-containing protein
MATCQKGFTLIELMIVVSIVLTLSTVVLTSVNQTRKKAFYTKNIQELKDIQVALESYYSIHGQYPVSQSSPGWEPSLGKWQVDCATSGFVIPELVAEGFYSATKKSPLNCSDGAYDGYSYGSNGLDYKLILYNTDSLKNIDTLFVDPSTDTNDQGQFGDMCVVDGTQYLFYGIWTSGAKCWQARFTCDVKDWCMYNSQTGQYN